MTGETASKPAAAKQATAKKAAPRRKAASTKAKKPPATNTREDLQAHMEAFLKAGGKVQQIPAGVSGQTSTSGPRQIVLSHKTS